jgi:2,3-bisphosphoglycerate-dependent phosphoglycerate mutase
LCYYGSVTDIKQRRTPMRLYLIRHGQSVNNALYEQGLERDRHFDPDLTEIGHEQARRVAQYLAENHDMPGRLSEPFKLSHLYCSAMTRAMQTTQPIAAALNIQPEVWVDVHETGGLFLTDDDNKVTAYPGLTRTEISTKFPGYTLPELITESGWWDVTRATEKPADYMARAIRVAQALRERADSPERIGIVTHGAFMDALIKAFLNQLPAHPHFLFYSHYNTAITRIDFGEGMDGHHLKDRMRLHYLNRVNHLPHELWTW